MHLLNIANYRDAIQEAMRLEATYEIINIEAKRRQNGGIGILLNSGASTAGSQAEPMEIGNLSMQQRTRKGQNHKNQGKNYTRNNYQNKGYQRKPFDKNKQRKNQMEVNNVNKDECLECGGKGHWAYECTTKQKKQKFRNNQNKGYNGNNREKKFQNNRKFQKNNFQKSNKVVNNLEQQEETYSETEAKNARSGAQFH